MAREDLQSLDKLFTADRDAHFGDAAPVFSRAASLTEMTIDAIGWFEHGAEDGRVAVDEAMEWVISQGHHRLIATIGF